MTLRLSLQQIADATSGRILSGDPDTMVKSVSTDSRDISKEQWFLALRGEKFDGHEFIAEVVERGAAGVIVEEKGDTGARFLASFQKPSLGTSETLPGPGSIIPQSSQEVISTLVVPDTLTAYGDIAHLWRKTVNPRVACIAGSNGKTTTKEIAATVLSGHDDVLVSKGNFNNLIGVPKTLLQIEEHHRLVLSELGMNMRGELARLTQIADPDVAALTNIGEAHVGQFGSIEALMLAKSELLMAMRPGTTLMANADCPRSVKAIEQFGGHLEIIWFGMGARADFRAENIESFSPWGYSFEFVHPTGRERVRMKVYGRHNVGNALCAATLLSQLGIGVNEIVEGIENFVPGAMRSAVEVIGGVTLVEDCYNASPMAMRMAIESLRDMTIPGRLHIVLGDMLELGEAEEEYHRGVGEHVARLPRVQLYTLGERARWIGDSAGKAGLQAIAAFHTHEDLAAELCANVHVGDAILIKGSRMMKLEQVARALKEHLKDSMN